MGLFKKLKEATGGTDTALMTNGVLGRGIVTGVQMTGTSLSMGGEEYRVCDVGIQVFLDGQQPYIARARQRIATWQLAQMQGGGAVVAVRVSPQNFQEIALDFQTEPPIVTLGAPPAGQGAAHLLATGMPSEAVVVQAVPLGIRNHEGNDMHLFTLTVMPTGQAPYQLQVGIPVPPLGLPLVFPGSKLPVKVAPGQDGGATVDWSAALAAS